MLRAGYCITRSLPSKLLAHYSVHYTSPYRSKTPESIRIRSGRTGGQRTLPQLNEGRGVPSSAFAYPSSPPPLLSPSPRRHPAYALQYDVHFLLNTEKAKYHHTCDARMACKIFHWLLVVACVMGCKWISTVPHQTQEQFLIRVTV